MEPRLDAQSAWVTGATSFLGRHVAKRLAAEGLAVVGFSRGAVPPDVAAGWGFKSIESGAFGLELLRRARERSGAPAVAFHAIGSGSVGQAGADSAADFVRTFESTELLVDALCQLAPAARLVYPSSAALYGVAPPGPISEDTTAQPVSVYGTNKLLTEIMCRERAQRARLDVVIARLFSVYGPPQRKLLLWDLGQRLLSGDREITLDGTGEETRDFIHVADAAAAVTRLALMPEPPAIVNIGAGLATSIKTLAAKFASHLGVNAEIRFTGRSRPGDPVHQQANISRLESIGCRSSVALDAGLADYGSWLRKNLSSDSATLAPH